MDSGQTLTNRGAVGRMNKVRKELLVSGERRPDDVIQTHVVVLQCPHERGFSGAADVI